MCFEPEPFTRGASTTANQQYARTQAGGGPAAYGELTQQAVAGKKSLINQQGGMEPLPPDVADALLKQAGTGRVMKARTGSTKNSFFAQAFSGPFSTQSILGDY